MNYTRITYEASYILANSAHNVNSKNGNERKSLPPLFLVKKEKCRGYCTNPGVGAKIGREWKGPVFGGLSLACSGFFPL